jgi:predicted RNase H-like HicB family nuclease
MELTAVLTPAEEGGYVAYNPETGTTSEGESIDEALANLKEATSLYLEEFPTGVSGHQLVVKRVRASSAEWWAKRSPRPAWPA